MEPDTLEQQQRASYAIAQAIAPTWTSRRDDIERFAAPVRTWLLHALDPHEGETILELAAGNGDTGFEAAQHLGTHGTLLTTDFSPAMLDGARRGAQKRGLDNVEFRVVDAQDIDLGDDAVDGVICRFGFMLMVDPQAALHEARRVLRPGGRLVFAVWGPPPKNPYFTAVVGALVGGEAIPVPDPDGPGVFRLADAGKLSEALGAAGFGEMRLEEVPVHYVASDIDAYLDFVGDTAGPIGLAIQGLDAEQRAVIAAGVRDQLRPYVAPGLIDVPAVALCAVAA